MASSSLLSEEQFLCPICLGVFTRPVSTPCGHNFCMSCITSYWDAAPACLCPLCKETFERRPDLKVNTFISGLATQFMALQVTDAHIWSRDQQREGRAVLCDVCADARQVAVKSCLECLTSYCDVHLEPHHRAAGLRRHTLVPPQPGLEDRMCMHHNRLLALFCRKDEALLCDACARLQHEGHDVVPVQQAYREVKATLGEVEGKVQRMIQETLRNVQDTKKSVAQSWTDTRDVIGGGVQDLEELASEIQQSKAELVRAIEEKQKSAADEAERFISRVEREVTQLMTSEEKLKDLRRTDDPLRFLQNFPTISLPPRVTDLPAFTFSHNFRIQHLRKSLSKCVSRLRASLNEMNADINRFREGAEACDAAALRHAQQHEVNVRLDPDTAHPLLVLSDDGRQVRYGGSPRPLTNRDLSPDMFTAHLAVLGLRGFSSCRFYFEVFVGEKTEWCLGLATASVQRNGVLPRSPHSGLWAVWFLKDKFESFCAPNVPVHLGKAERVGVFVDYDAGQITFYDVQTAVLIYSFTECVFTEKLYPYFNPCDNEYGSNLDPMKIVSSNFNLM